MPGDTPDADGGDPVGWASGISVDQVIANQIGSQSRFKSLEYGVACGIPDIFTRQSYSASEIAVEPEMDPYAAFNRLYGNVDLNLDEAQQRNLRLKSVLDAVIEDFNSISPRLSTADRQSLERHTQSVRELEKSLQTPDLSGNCLLPTMGARLDVQKNENIPHIGKLFMDLMVSALACEQTNVLSLQWTRAVSDARFVHLGINGGHHDMSHELDSNTEVREQLIQMNTWYGEQFAYLINNLKDTPDPSGQGSLLDNSFVIWGNELGKGNSHTLRNIPFVSAGNLQGSVNTGRYLQYNRSNHAGFLAAMANLYGSNLSGFGDYNEALLSI